MVQHVLCCSFRVAVWSGLYACERLCDCGDDLGDGSAEGFGGGGWDGVVVMGGGDGY